jgi:hypothetical protein
MKTTATGKRRIGAKIILYDDGTAEAAVYLIEADGELQFLSDQCTADRKAAETIVHTRAAEHGIPVEDIEICYDDTRTASLDMGRCMGKTH